MRIAKLILVILVGVSVAVLTAAAGFSGVPQAAAMSVSMPDCDHHTHSSTGKTQKADDDCISMTGCVFHCFSFTGTAAAVMLATVVAVALEPARISDRLSPQTGSLPFRPPRV